MITAVDTFVLIAIEQGEAGADEWLAVLAKCRRGGVVCVCDVVAAEFYSVVLEPERFSGILQDLGINRQAMSLRAVFRAGETFRAYRERGGPRQSLIPDFLIAAHAEVDADRLASADRGFLRSYFPRLRLVQP